MASVLLVSLLALVPASKSSSPPRNVGPGASIFGLVGRTLTLAVSAAPLPHHLAKRIQPPIDLFGPTGKPFFWDVAQSQSIPHPTPLHNPLGVSLARSRQRSQSDDADNQPPSPIAAGQPPWRPSLMSILISSLPSLPITGTASRRLLTFGTTLRMRRIRRWCSRGTCRTMPPTRVRSGQSPVLYLFMPTGMAFTSVS